MKILRIDKPHSKGSGGSDDGPVEVSPATIHNLQMQVKLLEVTVTMLKVAWPLTLFIGLLAGACLASTYFHR